MKINNIQNANLYSNQNYSLRKKNDYSTPKCFAAQNKNLESLFNSTSGSAFAGFAEKNFAVAHI